MQTSVMTQWFLPLALFVIMLGVGMTLRVDDFRRVLKAPRACAGGVAGTAAVYCLAWG